MGYDRYNHQPNFKPIDSIYEGRLRQFIDGGQYKPLNLPKFYDFERIDSSSDNISLQVWKVPDLDGKTQRPLFRDIAFDKIEWKDAKKGDSFGPSWKTFWFKIELEIPSHWLKTKNEIDWNWDCGNEGLIYDDHGVPLQAFTNGDRTIFSLPEKFRKSGKQLFYLEVACNNIMGNGDQGHPDENRYFQLTRADLVLPDIEARKLYWDFWILSDAARELPGGGNKYQAALIANEIIDTFDANDRKSIGRCRELASKFLGGDRDSDGVYAENPLEKIDVYGVGNCHIDTAWLWPFAETRRKIVRSWTTQLKIASEYPEYVFVASQMQQFKWLKEDHPEILEKIKKAFARNQFLPIGGSWVENDVNMPSGESLIRQFLLGQRFMLDEFGFTSNIFWLPDTFGYLSQVPQICQIVGIERFLTQKLSWNNINQFPLTTFNWKGIDGSQMLVHMPPANTYTAMAHFGDVVRSQGQHKNLRDVPTGLLLYGYGDGGGGPTEEMLEKLRRCRGIANTNASIPSVHIGNTVDEFYDDILEKSDQGRSLPTWTGEVYLEFHRGTYTTQADVKKWMRQAEVKMHDLELLATYLSVDKTHNYEYPAEEIRGLWEDIALCQFHDVLPGSCIGMVYYEEVKPKLQGVLKKVDKLLEKALKKIANSENEEVTAVNTLPWHRIELLEVANDKINSLDHDVIKNKGSHATVFGFNTESGRFIRKDDLKHPASIEKDKKAGVYVLGNGLIQAKINNNGVLTSLVDLVADREIIDTSCTKNSTGGGNQLVLFDDEPLSFPAWDTELYSLEKFRFLENGEVVSSTSHPLESKLVVKHKILEKSYIETTISIQGITGNTSLAQNNFIKFSAHVEWHEFYQFLKVQFPVTVSTPQFALYETQFGITQRPTHYNTSWDTAKFEVCHHKFFDLSEHNYGVSVMNNSKYGAAVHGNLLRLSLLRAPKAPDDKADMGSHDFAYAIYPHKGSLGMDTVHLAHNFNFPLLSASGKSDRVSDVLLTISLTGEDSLVLSNVKRAENDEDINNYENIAVENKGQKAAVVRVYEALGGLATGKLHFGRLPVDKVFRTNALEEQGEEIELQDSSVRISLKGFEIATYKVVFKG